MCVLNIYVVSVVSVSDLFPPVGSIMQQYNSDSAELPFLKHVQCTSCNILLLHAQFALFVWCVTGLYVFEKYGVIGNE